MAQKRKFGDFCSDMVAADVPSATVPERPAPTSASQLEASLKSPAMHIDQQSSADAAAAPIVAELQWEVAQSKKSKKKKKKAALKLEDEDVPPDLTFSTPVSSPLRIKDLQSLLLYALADGVAPQWIAVRQAKKIDQAVVLMVPGMDKVLLESFIRTTDVGKAAPSTPSANHQNGKGNTQVENGFDGIQDAPDVGEEGYSPESEVHSTSTLHLVPIKAPGDKITGKFYSPLQAMLISPEPKTKSSNHKKQDAFKPVATPIINFVHTADELLFAEYPVHPALFTDEKDAELENERREAASQSLASGWVDSNVHLSSPEPDGSDPNSLTQGLQVYAMDCEMVLTTDEKYSLARISLLNWFGKPVLDKYVKPALPIKDYFTQFSGITPKILEGVTCSLEQIQKELLGLLTPNSVLVGHSLESDLNALRLTHPFVVDTSLLYPHPRGLPLRSSLKFLANKYLKREIQNSTNGHDSVEDARAALDLVRLKCERGPNFGVVDANGESIFTRLARSGRKSAMIDYGKPEKGFGQCASVKIGCQDDDEITNGVLDVLKGYQDGTDKTAFVWGRLRDIENARGWNHNRDRNAATEAVPDAPTHSEKLGQASKATSFRLKSIYDALPESTVFVVHPGPGDMKEVLRLQDMHNQYKKEFKVKKWDELSVQWTDTEAQALRKAFDIARQGWVLIGIK